MGTPSSSVPRRAGRRLAKTPSARPRFARAALAAAAVMLSHCAQQGNRPDEVPIASAPSPAQDAEETPTATRPRPVPEALDTRDLDADERAIVVAVLDAQYDPCGDPRSFYESLEDPATCDDAHELGAMIVDLTTKGLNERQITQAYRDALSRRARVVDLELDGRPSYGADPSAASHVVVKFTDFECPFCRDASQPIKALAERHDAALYIKMMPLDMHANARALAIASLAAHRQGKFWEVYDAFFEHQAELSGDDPPIRSLVESAGVDMDRFDADVADPAVAETVDADLAEARRHEVRGTPTFFVDGREVDFTDLEAALSAPKTQE